MAWLRRSPRGTRRTRRTRRGPAIDGALADAGADGDDPTPPPVLRLRLLVNRIERHAALREQVRALAAAFWNDIDAASLYADTGFSARLTFAGELLARLQQQVLPATPERATGDGVQDAVRRLRRAWIAAIDARTMARAAALRPDTEQRRRPSSMRSRSRLSLRQRLRRRCASGWTARCWRRAVSPITPAREALRSAVLEGRHADALRGPMARALLDACRRAADSVLPHLRIRRVGRPRLELDQLHGRRPARRTARRLRAGARCGGRRRALGGRAAARAGRAARRARAVRAPLLAAGAANRCAQRRGRPGLHRHDPRRAPHDARPRRGWRRGSGGDHAAEVRDRRHRPRRLLGGSVDRRELRRQLRAGDGAALDRGHQAAGDDRPGAGRDAAQRARQQRR